MTDSNLTLIAALVDHSGSMQACRDNMEGGLNSLMLEQAQLPAAAEVTLAQFNHSYELVWSARPLTATLRYNLNPSGTTALLDAMGRFITETGTMLAAREEDAKPGKVIMVIVTDGYENASKEWTREQVKQLVTRQRSQWNWEFVFLGANMDAIGEAAGLGIDTSSALTFNTANSGVSVGLASNYISSYRVTGDAAFSDSDRQQAVQTP